MQLRQGGYVSPSFFLLHSDHHSRRRWLDAALLVDDDGRGWFQAEDVSLRHEVGVVLEEELDRGDGAMCC